MSASVYNVWFKCCMWRRVPYESKAPLHCGLCLENSPLYSVPGCCIYPMIITSKALTMFQMCFRHCVLLFPLNLPKDHLSPLLFLPHAFELVSLVSGPDKHCCCQTAAGTNVLAFVSFAYGVRFAECGFELSNTTPM